MAEFLGATALAFGVIFAVRIGSAVLFAAAGIVVLAGTLIGAA